MRNLFFAGLIRCGMVQSVRGAASSPDRFHFERGLVAQGCRAIAGVDEAGRGPLAGPVVAAAVILPSHWAIEGLPAEWTGLNDSKQLTAAARARFFDLITSHPQVRFSVSSVPPEVIDQVNILVATHRAMTEALRQLPMPPDHVLVDGLPVRAIRWPQTAIVQGDARSYSIAAASVLAKVTRDRVLLELDARYPAYGFASHKGYATAAHLSALERHGPCPEHRRSFAPIRRDQLELFGPNP